MVKIFSWHCECPWFETHTLLCSIGYFLLLTMFCTFALFFPIMANISTFLSHWLSHINFYSKFCQFMHHCKDCYACKNWWHLCIVLLREITQNKTDRNIANLSVRLLFLEKSTRERCLFLFFRQIIVYQGFYIWSLNRKYTSEKVLLRKRYFFPHETMVKVPCLVISESWKISKSVLVTISKVTMKIHNVQI